MALAYPYHIMFYVVILLCEYCHNPGSNKGSQIKLTFSEDVHNFVQMIFNQDPTKINGCIQMGKLFDILH